MHGLRWRTNTIQIITEVNDQEKRLHQKKPNGVILFGLIFLSVLSNLFSVDFPRNLCYTCHNETAKNSRSVLFNIIGICCSAEYVV